MTMNNVDFGLVFIFCSVGLIIIFLFYTLAEIKKKEIFEEIFSDFPLDKEELKELGKIIDKTNKDSDKALLIEIDVFLWRILIEKEKYLNSK